MAKGMDDRPEDKAKDDKPDDKADDKPAHAAQGPHAELKAWVRREIDMAIRGMSEEFRTEQNP